MNDREELIAKLHAIGILGHDAELAADFITEQTRLARIDELAYIDAIYAEYDSKREVWSVIQSHIRNRKAQLAPKPEKGKS